MALDLHYPQVLRIHHRALVHRRETVTGRKQEAVCFGDRTMWLWLLCTTTLPAHPATCPQQIVTHMSIVSFVILGQKKEWERHKFPLDCTQQPAAHPEKVQPVAHVDKALLGGDVVHEHHAVSLAEQLPGHAVVPAQTVRASDARHPDPRLRPL